MNFKAVERSILVAINEFLFSIFTYFYNLYNLNLIRATSV